MPEIVEKRRGRIRQEHVNSNNIDRIDEEREEVEDDQIDRDRENDEGNDDEELAMSFIS